MIWSVSTLGRSRAATTDVSLVNASMMLLLTLLGHARRQRPSDGADERLALLWAVYRESLEVGAGADIRVQSRWVLVEVHEGS